MRSLFPPNCPHCGGAQVDAITLHVAAAIVSLSPAAGAARIAAELEAEAIRRTPPREESGHGEDH